MWRLIVLGVVVWPPSQQASSHDSTQEIEVAIPAPDPTPEPPRTTRELVASMATMVGYLADATYLDDWARKLDSGTPIEAYIDELLATTRFGSEVVPALVFGAFVNVRNYYALPSGFVLKRTPDGVFYLREPCSRTDARTVHPWWDLASKVPVCPDSYRPDKWTVAPDEHSYRSHMALSCDSQVGSPELEASPLCGCGPNLVRCLRDPAQYEEHNRSLMNEVKQTTAYVVEHDLPIATLFTGNASFRDRNVELYYRRQKIGALAIEKADSELADLAQWPESGQWAPRPELRPGQHAGMLTAPQILHWLPDRRQRQRGYYEIMWCAMTNSFGATTKKVLELNGTGNLAFVHDSWERLAKTPLCTNCHARLDYGFQFFLGYPDSRAGTQFSPELQSKARGPLYGRDIEDPRGTGALTPIGFAKLAVAQPEFNGCIANHFINYALGGNASEADRREITAVVESSGRFKPIMKVALARFAAHWRTPPAPPPAAVAAVAAGGLPGAGVVTIGAELRAELDQCADCHDTSTPYTDDPDAGDIAFDFTPAMLPRPLVVAMADRVAFGMMPKDQVLAAPDRERLVTLLIETLWSDPEARREAQEYYLGRARGLPAHQIDNMIYAIDHVAQARSGIVWGSLERALVPEQTTATPGFLAIGGLEALKACTQGRKLDGGKLEDCLARTTSLQLLTRWPPPRVH
ncbi:MAG: hypothetical protein ABI867_05195 [Kofleriaceae bacterium]